MSTKTNKAAYAAAATVLSSLLLLGGTLAWQSINQQAKNEVSGEVNPGGRLHDDFNGVNKDIYVENFASENIYARIRLLEYLEIGDGAGLGMELSAGERYDENGNVYIPGEEAEPLTAAVVTAGAQAADKESWLVHRFDGANSTDGLCMWTMGGSTVYMPTFNTNKDSLEADINGTLQGLDGLYPWETGDAADEYSDCVIYAEGQEEHGFEIRDTDGNTVDELKLGGLDVYEYTVNGDPNAELGEYVVNGNVEISDTPLMHTAKNTDSALLISMADWLTMYEQAVAELGGGEAAEQEALLNLAPFWVYDTDGWCYYSKAISANSATGLLLDEVITAIDDNFYYAIHVEAQFITADDIGYMNSTGFYTEAVPTDEALNMLEKIGVIIPEDAMGGAAP